MVDIDILITTKVCRGIIQPIYMMLLNNYFKHDVVVGYLCGFNYTKSIEHTVSSPVTIELKKHIFNHNRI